MSYVCACCGETHEDLSSFGAEAPQPWRPKLEGARGCLLTEDFCVIEGRDYFVRGVLEIPVRDYEHPLGWGVWVSHKKENYEVYRKRFRKVPDFGPFFGWLCTALPYRKSSLGLKTMAHYHSQGERPKIVVEECDHPLSRQQRKGISLKEAWRMVHRCMDLQP